MNLKFIGVLVIVLIYMKELSKLDIKIIKNNEGIDTTITQKQVDVVSRILEKGKREFGSAGASLTHQINDPKYKDVGINSTLAKVGLEGEKKTDNFLKEWLKDKPQAVLIRSVHVKGFGKEEIDEETGALEGGDTDHILVIGHNIILIDSKNWKGKRKYSINEKGEIIRGTRVFKGGRVNTVAAKYLWLKYLSDFNLNNVFPIITITSEKVFVVRNNIWWKSQFHVVSLDDLDMFLSALWKKTNADNINEIDSNLVTAIVINAIRPYDFVHEKLRNAEYLLK